MVKPGYIRIKDQKVYFEYYELREPDNDRLKFALIMGYGKYKRASEEYTRDFIKYKASKQLIEVTNVKKKRISEMKTWVIMYYMDWMNKQRVYNNQPCKAEVTGKAATIIELIK